MFASEPLYFLYEKLLSKFNIGEGVDTFTSDKEFIEKIWQASMEHDYIPAEYDMLLIFVDSVRITP